MSTRRILAIGAMLVVSGAVLLAPGEAEPGNSAFGLSHRVCSAAAADVAACDALIVDDAKTGRPLATSSYKYGYAPADLVGAYGPFGNGSLTIAIIDAYAHPSAAADLKVYRDQFNLGTADLTQYNQDGGSISTVGANVGWGQEEMLDLEMASAICPECKLIYVGANSASLANLAAAVTTAKNLGAQVISNSYGAREFRSEGGVTAWNLPGLAVTVSSGDNGYGVEFPAASKGVIAVGGTTLTLNPDGSRLSETVWSGTGSGCSAYIGKPTWQTDGACSRRTVADVAAVADPQTGVAVYDSYGSSGNNNWYVFGGTSVSAPLIGAMFARGSAFAAGDLVAARLYSTSAGLYDVVAGSNGRCTNKRSTAAAYLCSAAVGYDGPTGNGTPNASSIFR